MCFVVQREFVMSPEPKIVKPFDFSASVGSLTGLGLQGLNTSAMNAGWAILQGRQVEALSPKLGAFCGSTCLGQSLLPSPCIETVVVVPEDKGDRQEKQN